MLLKNLEQSLEHKLWEFDVWVTPSIVDIRNTKRFRIELARILAVLDALSSGEHCALDPSRFASNLVDRVLERLDASQMPTAVADAIVNAQEFLVSLSALLFMVTGKSDNNHKCQFPIFLKNRIGWITLPGVRTRQKKWRRVDDPIPRVMDSEVYMARVAQLYAVGRSEHVATSGQDRSLRDIAANVLFQFVDCLLADAASQEQLSAFLQHYSRTRETGESPEPLLTPLVMFQVRGSVAASGGHEPEDLLRARLTDWGLMRGIDFNTTDVVLNVESGSIVEVAVESSEPPSGKTKTRAYDFVLPFRTPTWTPRIFVQSQFYAGDSGSVSHKNVDQTHSSRLKATELITKKWPNSPPPCFLEYVDGAGYSASLNGDLKSLLSFSDTAGFFQIRSAAIRLRRELQQIKFLTPLEIAHAVLRSKGVAEAARALLLREGYTIVEVQRVVGSAVDRGILKWSVDSAQLLIDSALMPLVRQYLILDLIACEGRPFASLAGLAGVALVPGYGPYYGLPLSELETCVNSHFAAVWPKSFMVDLQALCTAGFVVLR